MRLNVYYDEMLRTYEGDDEIELIRKSRKCDLYEKSRVVTFELEEVKEDGDYCCER